MADEASLITIPGDIKSRYLPFKLKSNPLEFTFRQKGSGKESGGVLNICPSTINSMFDDISLKACFGKDGAKKLDKKMLFDNLPGIQIREFLPDTRLQQCINFFTDILGSVTDLFTKDKKAMQSLQNKEPEPNPNNPTNSFFLILTEAMNWSLKYLTGTGEENLYKAISGTLRSNGGLGKWSGDSTLNNYVLNFPYILYYRFLSCQTTALYELPCMKDDKQMYFSEGKGWDGGSYFELVNSFVGNIPVLGSLMKTILGNVRIDYLPWWDSDSGHKTLAPAVTVKFDLFNDSAEAAIANFIFVNTIVPSNHWIQYNMFLHSSNLYDIKLEGYNRLFACLGKFEVKLAGVLRSPNRKWLEGLFKYKNANFGITIDDIISQLLIKIPDVYQVTMTFESLLPANFNNYIYTWSKNNTIISEYSGLKKQESIAIKMFDEGMKDFASKLKTHWDAEDFKNPAIDIEDAAELGFDSVDDMYDALSQGTFDSDEYYNNY